MALDLSKLSPAPWHADDSRHSDAWKLPNGQDDLEPGEVGWNILMGDPDPHECWAGLHGVAGNGTVVPEWADLEFVALARQAFDVMMRREWAPHRGHDGQWRACDNCAGDYGPPESVTGAGGFADPFTALVEADKWYREHVEHAS